MTADGFHRALNSWLGMFRRCLDVTDPGYTNYGGRGITICERWYDLRNFLADMGERPVGTSLDRINNEHGYCKENCRWADRFTQARNTRRNVYVEIAGERMTQAQAAIAAGVSPSTMFARVKKGRNLTERRGFKLSESEVVEIKSMTHLPAKTVAAMFGVTFECVRKIWTGKMWAHTGTPADPRVVAKSAALGLRLIETARRKQLLKCADK